MIQQTKRKLVFWRRLCIYCILTFRQSIQFLVLYSDLLIQSNEESVSPDQTFHTFCNLLYIYLYVSAVLSSSPVTNNITVYHSMSMMHSSRGFSFPSNQWFGECIYLRAASSSNNGSLLLATQGIIKKFSLIE